MASAKKKLDEYHLKILRQLLTLPTNKECFDCHQRGPTYVNVTIGSFVCTTCSGMLRGLTPPHRVKSVSMATFTPEEVDFVKARGNDYCRETWLGLLDTQQPTKDEQQIKDFMVAKYERKRFYVDPSIASTLNKSMNGNISTQSKPSAHREPTNTITVQPLPRTQSSVQNHPTSLAFKPPSKQKNQNMFTPDSFADFSNLSIPPPCDPFNSSQSAAAPVASLQPSFADFDNNPVFTNSSSSGMPGVGESGSVPGEDRYAALKDLDCLMKQQQQTTEVKPTPPPAAANGHEWGQGITNGVTTVWSSPLLFPTAMNETKDFNGTSNPFKGDGTWNNFNSPGANPFRNMRPASNDAWSQVPNGQIVNGFPTSQSLNFAAPKVPWSNEAVSNPFAVGAVPQSSHHSSNPFL